MLRVLRLIPLTDTIVVTRELDRNRPTSYPQTTIEMALKAPFELRHISDNIKVEICTISALQNDSLRFLMVGVSVECDNWQVRVR